MAFGSKAGMPPKIIFYGASFRGAEDLVWSPAHGRVPGVFQHAMALDNLLTLGDSYIHEPGSSNIPVVFLNGFVALLLAVTVVFPSNKFDGRQGSRVKRFFVKYRIVVSWLAIVIFIPLLVYVFVFILHIPPANWLGIFGIISIIKFIQRSRGEKIILQILGKFYKNSSPKSSVGI